MTRKKEIKIDPCSKCKANNAATLVFAGCMAEVLCHECLEGYKNTTSGKYLKSIPITDSNK